MAEWGFMHFSSVAGEEGGSGNVGGGRAAMPLLCGRDREREKEREEAREKIVNKFL